MGRDHTGVSNYYSSYDAHKLFDKLGDIGIEPIFFNELHYCKQCEVYVDNCDHDQKELLHISGSEGRKLLMNGENPPEWFMRKNVSDFVLNEIKNGNEVFVQ